MNQDTSRPAPEPPPPLAWALAGGILACGVASVALVLIHPVFMLLTAGAGIVFGHWATSGVSRDPRPTTAYRVARAGLGLAYVSVILLLARGCFGQVVDSPRERGRRINCGANLKQVGLACKMWADDHAGTFPPGFRILWNSKYLDAAKIYLCPSTKHKAATESAQVTDPQHCDYVYFGAGQTAENPDCAKTVLAADRTGNHQGYWNVLFADGHVEGLDAAPGTDFATAVRAKGWTLPGAAGKP